MINVNTTIFLCKLYKQSIARDKIMPLLLNIEYNSAIFFNNFLISFHGLSIEDVNLVGTCNELLFLIRNTIILLFASIIIICGTYIRTRGNKDYFTENTIFGINLLFKY